MIMTTETQKILPKNNYCPQCQQPNHTLHWHEIAKGFVCPGCATNRQAEQQKLDAKFKQLNIHQETFDNRIIKAQKRISKLDNV